MSKEGEEFLNDLRQGLASLKAYRRGAGGVRVTTLRRTDADVTPCEYLEDKESSFYEDMVSAFDELSAWVRGEKELRVTKVQVEEDDEEEPEYYVVFQQGPIGWTATVPDLPGCVATGAAQWEAEEAIMRAMARYRTALAEKGEAIPAARAYAKAVPVATEADLASFD